MPSPSRIVYPSRPRPQKPFPKKVLLVAAGFLFIAILIAGLWYIANLPYLRVDKIEISGSRLLSASEIESAARKNISGVLWLVIPRDNFFFVSSRRIADDLGQQFPQTSEIIVNKSFPDKLGVIIKERVLWGIYCIKQGGTASPCFYIDRNGIAYEILGAVAGSLMPLVYSPTPAEIGRIALPQPIREFYEGAARALESIPLKLVSLELATSTRDVRLNTDESWYVLAPLQDISYRWLTVLDTVLEREIGQRRGELEYVDLRFGNKVFYKYR